LKRAGHNDPCKNTAVEYMGVKINIVDTPAMLISG